MADAVVDTWRDIATATPAGDADRFVRVRQRLPGRR